MSKEDREKGFYGLKGSLMAVGLTVGVLMIVVAVGMFYLMQIQSLHIGLRIGAGVLLGAVILSALYHYRRWASKIGKDLKNETKYIVLGNIARAVKEENDNVETGYLDIDSGEGWIKIRTDQLRAVAPDLYRNRMDLKVGDSVRADLTMHAAVLLTFRRMEDEDYLLFFDEELMPDDASEPDVNNSLYKGEERDV